ncbi:DUF4179 domain-containing protein [Clostridium sp.]|uniref:DUF4179 domain-containing protein n=1 Tax=Clostridium sp. TaxID=1506 RepID=UPI003F3BCDE1
MKHINMDDIKVSSKLDDIIKASVDKGYNNISYKNKRNYKKILIASTLIAVFGVSVLGTISNKEVFASVKVFISHISNFLGLNNDLNEYRIEVDKSIYKDGLTVTLNEAILNKDEIIISTLIKSDTILGKNDIVSVSGSAYINGEKISNSVGGISKRIDEHTVESVDIYNLTSELTVGEALIEIKNTAAYININNEKTTIDGPWNFEFKANGDVLNSNTKDIKIDHSFTLENNEKIILNKYVSNDVGQKIYYNIANKDINSPYVLLVLKGYDDLGNTVEFYTSYDELTKGLMKNQTEISEEASSITLTPYAVVYPKESGKISNDLKKVGEEFTINIK